MFSGSDQYSRIRSGSWLRGTFRLLTDYYFSASLSLTGFAERPSPTPQLRPGYRKAFGKLGWVKDICSPYFKGLKL